MTNFIDEKYDVVVIGAGHAGCEAGLASARLGLKTAILTISMDSVADMPCNPNIGGTGKGHLVREIDALGGEMAINIDKTFIQSRMLNTSKGPAVHSLRVQADKKMYHTEMKKVLENEKNIDLIQAEVKEILTENNEITGVLTTSNEIFPAKAVIICTGTYLKSMILIGENCYESGPNNWKCSTYLSDSLRNLGIPLRRFKTGTPARVHRDSIDYSKMDIQKGDDNIIPFSFMNEGKDIGNHKEDCFLTYTTLETKKIIEQNLHRSPMYAGIVKGVGPRYCPSIEDKIVRFNEKDEHQVFIEPEGLDTSEMYVQGVSSTLPLEVQKQMYKSILGLENVKIMRPAYGIEYDCIDPTILRATLEHKDIKNLFFAGQINGSSGYEEAASQGIIAGINSAMNILGKEPFVLTRSDAYIGVLIDDLITKGTDEPYRMMTSRTEYRLSLRQDNADLRLTEMSYNIGLATKERYEKCLNKKTLIENEIERLKSSILTPKENTNNALEALGSMKLKTAVSLYDLIKRPELDYEIIKDLDTTREPLDREIKMQVQTMIKYEGYIEKQSQQIEAFKKLENKKLENIDYNSLSGLRIEAVQKLAKFRPETVGQASRISGVSPADINVLLIHLETQRRKNG
ncbi:tRNA uridine-5-carboxymethylaminomethyl(34) synthesis enzyme MnmG [Parvimonas micra]|uniref:tRNA uridine 5-carboxymethylaminomethyl modification enzyme MnmG n=1 Tax=Parvimonas micra ATCC 33270 TaxID=411465 RepID=A8SJZ1_9FIRM|nr:tRNA uridine-5-carboxymethylaminomethyl(34) synthesis enzyme MnmG [Parvimonas micra]EDP23951.1 tRNA uridine 5-carboxymethylaminomethyl modification enzyme GidA [Parvimonas micra ATCC 33270]RSB90235.1 tRNA uridine-5-carboxymethylaminomethyl(34) synthesis enzyme MnmG [Parvimonas micra]WBB33899.1 tRNA uridine-5-carboxymethylaminomethyl(34) synthesis enzyme MnmG [Parvimonas micra]WBB35420.1 tRNA uridine-5-carboxymethylaminomethyl(34) synthesis enzyme MnmG [Parvimonas micra]VEH96392.1 Glucose-in